MKKIETETVFPKTRAECIDGPRPCPWIRCKYHILWFENILKYDDRTILKKLFSMPETCVLDVAGRDGITFSEIGDIFGRSKQFIHQLNLVGKLRHPSRKRQLVDFYESDFDVSFTHRNTAFSLPPVDELWMEI